MEVAWGWALVDLMEEWAWVALVVPTGEWVATEVSVEDLGADLEVDMVGATVAMEDLVV